MGLWLVVFFWDVDEECGGECCEVDEDVEVGVVEIGVWVCCGWVVDGCVEECDDYEGYVLWGKWLDGVVVGYDWFDDCWFGVFVDVDVYVGGEWGEVVYWFDVVVGIFYVWEVFGVVCFEVVCDVVDCV